MNKLNYEILSAIDNIETTVMESEMNVMNSLIDSYDKVIMVLENCNDINDVSAFDIFQESVIMETDGGNTGDGTEPKKSFGKIILDILLFIPRMIKKAYLIIKKKLSQIFGPLKEAIVNKVKKLFGKVDGEPMTFEIMIPNDGSKPQVDVTIESHNTEKEEEIKSKIESIICVEAIPSSSSPQRSSTIDGSTGGDSNKPVSVIDNNNNKSTTNTVIRISENDIEIEFTDYSKIVEDISFRCKKISALFVNINIERMGKPKYNQEFAKAVNTAIVGISNNTNVRMDKMSYSDFVKYTNNMKASLDASMNILKTCGDTLEKSINVYKNKNRLNKMPEKAIKGEAKSVINSIKLIKNSIHVLIQLSLTSADSINKEYTRVNEYIGTLASSGS